MRVWQDGGLDALQNDNDFAYAFFSFEDAVQVAGHEVAAAWRKARSQAADYSALALAHAAAVAGSQSPAAAYQLLLEAAWDDCGAPDTSGCIL